MACSVSVFFFRVKVNSSWLSESYPYLRLRFDQLRLLPTDRLGAFQRQTGQRVFVRLQIRAVVEDKHLFGAQKVLYGETELVRLEERQVGFLLLLEECVEAQKPESQLRFELGCVVDVLVLGLVQSVESRVAPSEHVLDCVSGGVRWS